LVFFLQLKEFHVKEIVIDGVRHVPAEQANGELKIVVLDHGFVYVGRFESDGSQIVIHGARSLIRWGTTAHLGELINGPLDNTKLGDRCTVRAMLEQVKHTIEVNQDAWNNHAG
jgi:hypothetical protein